ncbi:hypothetical protein UlMin_013042 [Ulmus minor]
MAPSMHLFIILAIVATLAPSISAVEFVVGDGTGWTINFVPSLYPNGAHNVLKVNGTGFQQCVAPLNSVPLTTGNDVITLATPGRKWYICGVGQHCEVGNQKLFINVFERVSSPSSSPSPSPKEKPSSATTSSASRFGFVVVIINGRSWSISCLIITYISPTPINYSLCHIFVDFVIVFLPQLGLKFCHRKLGTFGHVLLYFTTFCDYL